MIGQNVANFRIERQLGQGGMGIVYLATDLRLDRRVAIKMLHPQHSTNTDFVKRFENEAKLTARISHPNVTTLFDVIDVNCSKALVMEYVEGQTLEHLIQKNGKIDADLALIYTREILAALVAAHDLGIMHRDLKPANVMITNAGQVKLMDFGIARKTSAPRFTQERKIIGTLEYLAPEILRGEAPSFAADFYALGVIYYEMLVGQTPFDAPSEAALIHNIVEGKHRLMKVHAGARSVIKKLISTSPKRRMLSGLPADSVKPVSKWRFVSSGFTILLKKLRNSAMELDGAKGLNDLREIFFRSTVIQRLCSGFVLCSILVLLQSSETPKEIELFPLERQVKTEKSLTQVQNTLPFRPAHIERALPEFTSQAAPMTISETESESDQAAEIGEERSDLKESPIRDDGAMPLQKHEKNVPEPVLAKAEVEKPTEVIRDESSSDQSQKPTSERQTFLKEILKKSKSKRKLKLYRMPISISLMENITPNTHRRGDTFYAECMSPVYHDGILIVAAGAKIKGVVRKSKLPTARRGGEFKVDLTWAESVTGKSLALSCETHELDLEKSNVLKRGFIFEHVEIMPATITVIQ